MKTSLEGLNSRFGMADETIHELKIIQSEEVKKNDEM
jgi:hypothetical protein